MEVAFVSAPGAFEGQALAVLAVEGQEFSANARQHDAASGGALLRAAAMRGFTGKAGETLDLIAPPGKGLSSLCVIGAGPKPDSLAVERAGADAMAGVRTSGADILTLDFDVPPALAAQAALGAVLAAYSFDRYRTGPSPYGDTSITRVEVVTGDPEAARAIWASMKAVADGVILARDLVNEPANILHPEEFGRRMAALAALGIEVEILGEAAMEALGMGSLLSVGLGSRRESQLVVMRWNGADDPAAPPLGLVGKGVCFDSGGLSLKMAVDIMEDMKWDMGGAAAIAGLLHTLAVRKAKVNVVGVLGLVENMPDGNATRPSDVVTSMSGKTIEIINIDAEGRLVLADALFYCAERFKPSFMIDLATLTGAMNVSLGNDLAGLFANDETLCAQLLQAGQDEGEQLWRLPLHPAYEKQLDSRIADIRNIGESAGRSIIAALFLQRFTAGVPWAHLDINPVVWAKTGTRAVTPVGATGFGVRLLNRLVADYFETGA